MATLLPGSTVTTTVRTLSGCFCGFGLGCGTSASRPFGLLGATTMKMISSTSSTSISGVMLMSALAPPPAPPTAIAITNSPLNACCLSLTALLRRARSLLLQLFCQQADLVHARRADVVHHLDHHPVLRPGVTVHVDRLVHPVTDQIFHL